MYSLDWSRAYAYPQSTAQFKYSPDDFHVHEFFAAPFSGEGEHIVLRIEKIGLTTEELVKSLSKLVHKSVKFISYAGLKDRQALSTQWLSIHVPGGEIPGIEHMTGPGWRVLECTRHNKKLKPGFLAGNRFVVRLRELTEPDALLQRVAQIKELGVPNYFGEQRFGREAGNLIKAEEMLLQNRRVNNRFLQGMYLSAARSWIFNLIVSQRVSEQNWNIPLRGDVMQLHGSNSIFVAEELDEALVKRVRDKDVSPASPLVGKSKNKVKDDALELINKVIETWLPWISALERFGVEEAWRANILYPEQLECVIKDNMAELSFTLPAGAYATSLLRELVVY